MDIPILVLALIGLGVYCTRLLSRIERLIEQNYSMENVIDAMGRELMELGSPNVIIFDEEKESPPE